MSLVDLFPTTYQYLPLIKDARKRERFLADLRSEIPRIRDFDVKGRKWSAKNYMGGYTSYGTLSELHNFSSTFAALRDVLDTHVQSFAKSLDADLKNHKLELTQMWVNVMPSGVVHSGHLHPLSSVSGTLYIDVPKGSSGLKFEDPRLACFMGSIPRKSLAGHARSERYHSIEAKQGHVVLFESWLRHEVPPNPSKDERVSVSFNYNWF
ncbi:MAG: TIGR02466 family protein [Bdellovibrionota bacterium]